MSEVLLVERSEGIATLTLNRPAVLNALSRELRAAITHAFEELKEDAETGVVILTGAGRAFCAGVDLKEIGGEGGATCHPCARSEVLPRCRVAQGSSSPRPCTSPYGRSGRSSSGP